MCGSYVQWKELKFTFMQMQYAIEKLKMQVWNVSTIL